MHNVKGIIERKVESFFGALLSLLKYTRLLVIDLFDGFGSSHFGSMIMFAPIVVYNFSFSFIRLLFRFSSLGNT